MQPFCLYFSFIILQYSKKHLPTKKKIIENYKPEGKLNIQLIF